MGHIFTPWPAPKLAEAAKWYWNTAGRRSHWMEHGTHLVTTRRLLDGNHASKCQQSVRKWDWTLHGGHHALGVLTLFAFIIWNGSKNRLCKKPHDYQGSFAMYPDTPPWKEQFDLPSTARPAKAISRKKFHFLERTRPWVNAKPFFPDSETPTTQYKVRRWNSYHSAVRKKCHHFDGKES